MIYQLPNGKSIEISVEQFLQMTDEDLEYFIAYNHGEEFEDPWVGSILGAEPEYPDISDVMELPDIPLSERLSDSDLIPDED